MISEKYVKFISNSYKNPQSLSTIIPYDISLYTILSLSLSQKKEKNDQKQEAIFEQSSSKKYTNHLQNS